MTYDYDDWQREMNTLNPLNKGDKSLPVLPELPDGYMPTTLTLSTIKEAYNRTPQDGRERHYHFCPTCNGWIAGLHNTVEHNSLSNQLSGRKGKAYHCCRCGRELWFDGAVA